MEINEPINNNNESIINTNQIVINNNIDDTNDKPYKSKKLFVKTSNLSEERLDICKEIFLKYLEIIKIDKTKYNEIIPIALQLTSICWRKFKYFVESYGYYAKRRRVTQEELIALSDKSKRSKYIISVIKADCIKTSKKNESDNNISVGINNNNSINSTIESSNHTSDQQNLYLLDHSGGFEPNYFYYPSNDQWTG